MSFLNKIFKSYSEKDVNLGLDSNKIGQLFLDRRHPFMLLLPIAFGM